MVLPDAAWSRRVSGALANALAVRHHMETLPVTVTYREFPGEHEIRPSELAATVAWLEGLSTTPTAF